MSGKPPVVVIGMQGPPGPAGPAGPAGGPPGPAGANGLNGKSVLGGPTEPMPNDGTVGDYWINTVANTIYGPKQSGGWGFPRSLVGPVGPPGTPGAAGPPGTTIYSQLAGNPGPREFLLDRASHTGLQPTSTIAGLDALLAAVGGGARAYDTLTAINAVTVLPANTLGYVSNDPTPANNGMYRYTGAVWVKSTYDPLTQALAAVAQVLPSVNVAPAAGMPYSILDQVFRVILGVDAQGSLLLRGATLSDSVPGYELVATDVCGRLLFALPTGGDLYIHGVAPANAPPPPSIPEPDDLLSLASVEADYMSAPCYGQSLSRGTKSFPALSLSQPYANRMLAGGVRTADAGVARTTLIPLVEADAPAGNIDRGETPASGMLNQLVLLQGGSSARSYVGFAPGLGGRSIADLSKTGDGTWAALVSDLTAVQTIAAAEGKTHSFPFWSWTQGEADYVDNTDPNLYYQRLLTLQNDVADLARTVTGQGYRPVCLVSQVASHRAYSRDVPGIALAQWRAHRNSRDIRMACAMYQLEYATDGVHLTAEGSRMLGRYFALAAKRIVWDRDLWRGLTPIRLWRSGANQIDIQFNVPFGSLAFESAWVATTRNQGFDIRTAANVVRDIITAVSLVGTDTVRLTLSAAPAVGDKVVYGWGRPGDSDNSNRLTGPRGNLRDQQGDLHQYVGADTVIRRLDNYCPIFEWML